MSVNQGSVNFFSPAALIPAPPLLSASNGIHIDFDTIKLGGNLYENTSIISTGATFLIKGFNASYYLDSDQIMAGSIFEFNGDKDGMLLHVGKGSGAKNVFHVDKRHPSPTEISRTYFEVNGTNEIISIGIVEGTLGQSPVNRFTLNNDGWSNKFSDVNNNVLWDYKHVESDDTLSYLDLFNQAIKLNSTINFFRKSLVVDLNMGYSELSPELGEISQCMINGGTNAGLVAGNSFNQFAAGVASNAFIVSKYNFINGYENVMSVTTNTLSIPTLILSAKTIVTGVGNAEFSFGNVSGGTFTLDTLNCITIQINGVDFKLALVN